MTDEQTYHKARVHDVDGTKIASIVVWDGIEDYESEPPIHALIVAEKFNAKKLHVIQVGENWKEGEWRFQMGISAAHEGTDVIFYAINHRVYRQLCRSVEAACDMRLQ
jgi:hypothetical protein